MPQNELAVQAFLRTLGPEMSIALARHQADEGRSLDIPALVTWLGTDLPSVIASLAKLFMIITT